MAIGNQEGMNRKIIYGPIKLVMSYFIGLIILYIWGPMDWNTQNPVLFYSFLLFSHGFLYLGYSSTMKKMIRKEILSPEIEKNKRLILDHQVLLKWMKVLIIINLVMTVMIVIRTMGLSSFSINQITSNFVEGLTNAGGQYNSKFTTEKIFGGGILAPIHTLMSPILWPVLPLSIIYFKDIGLINKTLAIITIIFEAIRWISIGTNKGIIDLVLIVVAIVLLKQWQSRYDGLVKVKSKRHNRIRSAVIMLLCMIIGASVFMNNISSRVNERYEVVSAITNNTNVNFESPLMKILPSNAQPLLLYASAYLCQGYYGLSLSLDEPWVPMFGIGSSYFLIENFEQLLDVDVWQNSYQSRIEYKGWDSFVNWHSIYSWLANDFSYPGVLVLMILLGKYFAVVYYKSLTNKDPVASVLFCLIFICFFYSSANNQVMSTPSTYMAFIGLNVFWLYRTKFTRRESKMVHSQTKNEITPILKTDESYN